MKQLNKLFVNKFFFYPSILIIISIFTLIAVFPSFNLALSGDDWLLHYSIWHDFELGKSNYFNLLTYLCTYCTNTPLPALIKFFWGISPFHHYLFSYFSRVIVALSIFLLTKKITQKNSLAFLASIFFAVNYLGIETTDWAFNMNHYLGVAAVCLFFVSYWKAQNIEKIKYMVISAILFASALVISPPRMHGLFPLILFSELMLYLIKRKKFSFKMGFARITIIFITYIFIFSWLGKIIKFLVDNGFKFDPGSAISGYGTTQYNLQRVQDGISFAQILFSKGQTDFTVNLFATLGNYILPDRLLSILPLNHTIGFGIITYIIWTILTFLALQLFNPKKHHLYLYLASLVLWTICIYILKLFNQETFIPIRITFSLAGGYTIIFSIFLFFLIKKEFPILAYLFAMSFGWMNTFSLFPSLLEPFGIIFTWGRYSIQQGAGLSIWMAILIYLVVIKLKEKRLYSYLGIPYSFALAFLLMHLIFSNIYLQHVGTYRSIELDKRLWNQITTFVPKIDTDSKSIFFLVSHPTVFETAETGLRFGFSSRSAMLYNITDRNLNPNMVVNNYQALLSSVFKESVSLNNVYGLYLNENQQLSDVTTPVRQKLTEDLEALRKGTLTLPQ